MNETIEVCCLLFPDATSLWFPVGDHDAGKLIEAWKERLSPELRRQYHDSACLGAVAHLRMLRRDYNSIPATSQSAALFDAARSA
jgi:hypothetical protein